MASQLLAHLGLFSVQLSYAAYHVITKVALNGGINQLVFCVYRDLIAWAAIVPIAYFKERGSRPPLTKQLLITFFVLGVLGVYLNQLFFTLGLALTAPAFAAATQLAVPVYTALLAVLIGTEPLYWRRADGKAKVGGILSCVAGALVLTLYKGPPTIGDGYEINYVGADGGKPAPEPMSFIGSAMLAVGLDSFHVGAILLLINTICLAAYFAIQAPVLVRYPHSLSLTAYTYTVGLFFMILTFLCASSNFADFALTGPEIYAVLYGGLFASAYNYIVMTTSNKALGPSIVALYIPLQPILSSILSNIFLGTSVFLGSILGAILIVIGLYAVTWSRKEAERQGSSFPRRSSPITEALRGESSGGAKDPLLKVLGQRVVSHNTGPSPPHSNSWVDSL